MVNVSAAWCQTWIKTYSQQEVILTTLVPQNQLTEIDAAPHFHPVELPF
jgi:hypothetical protein